jgi:esterase/lipase
MKFLKKIGIGFLVVSIFLVIAYRFGPKPAAPKLNEKYSFKINDSLAQLEKQLMAEEKATIGLREGCEAKIYWNDSLKKNKTGKVFLYLHGFSASQIEGDPVHRQVAKTFGANLYVNRLAGHGIFLGDSTMYNLTADQMIESAEKSLEIAKKLGDTVYVISTSFGGAMALYLASIHPEIKAIATYSPCIKLFDDNAELLDNHWGLAAAKAITGSEVRNLTPNNPDHAKYWNMQYHMNGVVALQNFLTHTMNRETFKKVTCPVMLNYWYKNDSIQDKVVSVKAMETMYIELGTTEPNKRKIVYPNAQNHVLASYVLSNEVDLVKENTIAFFKEIVKIK